MAENKKIVPSSSNSEISLQADNPVERLADKALSSPVAKILLSFNPATSLLRDLYTDIVASEKEEKVLQFLNDFNGRLKTLEGIAMTENLYNAVYKVLRQIYWESNKEKVNYLKGLLFNSIGSEETLGTNFDFLLQRLSSLSINHIRILKDYYDGWGHLTEIQRKDIENPTEVKDLADKFRDLPASLIQGLCDDLKGMGFLADWFIGRMDYRPGVYYLTDYGRDFVKTFI
jgi:hypothetical protein